MKKFDSIDSAIESFKEGGMIVVVDDPNRENEGDIIFSAESVTPEKINFLAKNARGLVCTPVSLEIAKRLNLKEMCGKNDPHTCNFSVSIDLREGIETGISAYDRAKTILKIIDEKSKPDDFVRPGHVLPIIARKGGVLVRAGHTEASVDLATLSGKKKAGVICEVMNEDGTMARRDDLFKFADKYKLKIITIEDLIAHRRQNEKLIEEISSVPFPTKFGDFDLKVFQDSIEKKDHLALITKDFSKSKKTPLVRVHSECLTGDVFHSKRCDCGDQLEDSLKMIAKSGKGVFLYMRQEGRGIGLANKIKAYCLQDKGKDTVEANLELGFEPDLRDYGIGAQILVDLEVKEMNLITNNPKKIVGLEGYGLKIKKRISIETEVRKENEKYLKTKKEKMGHIIKGV